MTTSRIKVSYSAPTNFLASDQWTQIRTALEARLPLRYLVRKPRTATATTSNTSPPTPSSNESHVEKIDTLQVELVALDSMKDEGSSQVPSSILDRPLVNLYFFACEDNEAYKTTYKKLVKDWQASVTSPTRRHQEWIVILVVRPDLRSSTTTARLFSMRAGVLDKVKADINTDRKRERCVELVWPVLLASGGGGAATTPPTDDGWKEVEEKLKEAVMTAFESYVFARREEIAKSEGQRTMPGWNFCTYFILKESLASSFDGMGLLEDALEVYIELETSFSQALLERNLPWFGNLGGTATGDDSRSILSTTSKPYHDFIIANTITLFDFRIYLFAKQMALLGKMGRIREVLVRAKEFIVHFARSLKENENSFTPFFIESWIYSASLNTVAQCDRAFAVIKEGNTVGFITQYTVAKGELVELSRHQLDKIGVHLGHLTAIPPFSLSLPSSFTHPRFTNGETLISKITRPELVEVLASKDAFDRLYVKITQDAIDCFVEGKRRKWALKLHGDLAAFDLSRGNFPTAHQTYASLPAHYAPPRHPYPPLEAFMLARSLGAHVKTGRDLDRAWLENALTFLSVCTTAAGDAGLVETGEQEENGGAAAERRQVYLEGLLRDIRLAADGLAEELLRAEHSAFSVGLPRPEARLAGDQDGSYLDVLITNHIPCDVLVDKMTVGVGPSDDTGFYFGHGQSLIHPGDNMLSLFCPDTHAGTFSLDHISLWISKVHFQWKHPEDSAGVPSPNPTPSTNQVSLSTRSLESNQRTIRIPIDRDALDVKLSLPQTIQWDAPPTAMFTLHAGRNHIEQAVIRVHGPNGVAFRLGEAVLLSDTLGDSRPADLLATEDHIILKDVQRGWVVAFTVPHSSPPAGGMLAASIGVEYAVKDSNNKRPASQLRRKFAAIRRISTALPLQVSVMDSFRGVVLISKFTISSTSHLQVRVLDTHLEGGSGLRIRSPRKGPNQVSTMVTPQRPARFLYQIESEAPRYERETLHFHITYRSMREEIELRVKREVARTFDGQQELMERAQAFLFEALAADASWIRLYINAEELDIPMKEPGKIDSDLEPGIRSVLENLKRPVTGGDDDEQQDDLGGWQKLIIPVDLPFMHILCAVEVNLQGDLDSIYAGQPVAVCVEISSSFHWGAVLDPATKEYNMRYVVQESVTDWLVSGHKRGDFVATDGGSHSVNLTLVPLHHGELSLPTIAVTPLPTSSGPGMQYASAALPSTETYHVRAARRIMVLPRGGRSTFVVGMSGDT